MSDDRREREPLVNAWDSDDEDIDDDGDDYDDEDDDDIQI